MKPLPSRHLTTVSEKFDAYTNKRYRGTTKTVKKISHWKTDIIINASLYQLNQTFNETEERIKVHLYCYFFIQIKGLDQ